VPGVGAGLVAMISFIVIHSLLIAPIWTRAANGLPLAAAAPESPLPQCAAGSSARTST